MERRGPRESGFTIIEVVVAVFVLVMAALATFGLLSSATKNTERAKATQVALDRAQQEIEALRNIPYAKLAMTAAGAHSSDPLDPGYRVSNSTFAVKREPRGEYEAMVVNGGVLFTKNGEQTTISEGVVSPGPTPFTSGDVSGEVYRYVVWRRDEKCSAEECPVPQDYKQIVVAVKLDKPGNQAGERGYVEVQSNFVDPTRSLVDNPVPGEQGVVTAQQFFLTDTPCAAEGSTERQEIAGDHLLHNTLGICADGVQTEEEPGKTSPGAPDALLLGQPPDPQPEDPSLPLLYDYSNDAYLEPSPDTDHGVQILTPKEKGCSYSPTGTHPEAQVHRWVTDKMKSDFKLTGKVTIEFYTRTLVPEEVTKATLCVYLFKRQTNGSSPEDTPLYNNNGGTPYWTYTPEGNGWWPSSGWTKSRLTMNINVAETPYTIPEGYRLGVALSVEEGNTKAEAIPVMYDHPNYPTRIEVDTNTPIEGG